MIGRLTRIIPAIAVVSGILAVAAPALPAQARSAGAPVPCDSGALASAIGGATAGEVLRLAPSCVYRLNAGLPEIDQTLTIEGRGATLERSLAPGTPPFAILEIFNGDPVIDDLNFRNGVPAIRLTGPADKVFVNGGTFKDNHGAGAIVSDNAGYGPVVNRATFIDNSSGGSGGAITDLSDAAGAIVTDSAFYGNRATGSGGAIYDAAQEGNLFSGDVFSGNSAQQGGAILDGDEAPIENCKIFDNSASQGGGIFMVPDIPFGGTTVSNSKIYGNRAVAGAGIYNLSTSAFTDDTIYGNRATAAGGAFYSSGSDAVPIPATLTGTKLSGNYAGTEGGGIFDAQGSVTVTQSSVVHNAAGSAGGGIYLDDPAGLITLTDTEVRYNRPDNCEPAGVITGCAS